MSKTTINKAIEAAEHPILLESPAQLKEAEETWVKSNILGIDTEFVRERTYRADLGLVQISDGRTAWLVDPLAMNSLEPVAQLMANSAITKILHSSSEDLEVLMKSGVESTNLTYEGDRHMAWEHADDHQSRMIRGE